MKTNLNWKILKPSASLLILTALPADAQAQSAVIWSSPSFFTNGACRVIADQTVNNSGAVLWGDGKDLTLSGGSVFNNLADGVFKVTNNGSMVYDASSAFNNFGLFEQMTGDGTTYMGNFTNYGTVSLRSGTLSFAYDYNQMSGATILAGGSLNTWPNHVSILGGVLEGQGTIEAGDWNPGVFNNGTIFPTGLLKIMDASYSQTSAGAIVIALGGTNSGSDYGQLNVARNATLDGTLNITLADGFKPRLGDSFQVLQCGLRRGQFAAINGPELGAGLTLQPKYTAKGLTLTVVESRPDSPVKQVMAKTGSKLDGQSEMDEMLSYQP